eukprot:Skav223764  [mRNA]  locus=scaffold521:33295:36042:+ [translate_table: standard]
MTRSKNTAVLIAAGFVELRNLFGKALTKHCFTQIRLFVEFQDHGRWRHSLDFSVTDVFEQVMVKCGVHNDSLHWSEFERLLKQIHRLFGCIRETTAHALALTSCQRSNVLLRLLCLQLSYLCLRGSAQEVENDIELIGASTRMEAWIFSMLPIRRERIA